MTIHELEAKKVKIATNLSSLTKKVAGIYLEESERASVWAAFSKASAKAIYEGERIIRDLRDFASIHCPPNTDIHKYDLKETAKILDISVSDGDENNTGAVLITVPCLLPHREKADKGFVTLSLIRALDDYIYDKPDFEKFKHCDICVTHIYNKNETKFTHIRDHDNFELKKIMDVIAMYLLTSDSGYFCNTHVFTEFGERNMARIEVMDSDKLPAWILRRYSYTKNYPKIT